MNNSIIEKTWNELEDSNPAGKEIIYRRHSPDSHAEIFVGITIPDKKRFIALPAHPGDIDASRLNKKYTEISFNLFKKEHYDGRDLFTITLSSNSKSELFAVLCNDLISKVESVREEKGIIPEVLKRIAGWEQLFFKYKKRKMRDYEQRGLFGELLLMKMLVEDGFDITWCLKAWNEQYNQAQDYRFNNVAIEVKTTLAGSPPKMRISSEYQLDDVDGLPIYLFHLRIKPDDSGLSLSGIIDFLSNSFISYEQKNRFYLKLAHRGYYLSDKHEYDSPGYKLSKHTAYKVADDFPRIVRSQLTEMIIEVRYHLLEPLKEEWITSQQHIFNLIKEGQNDTKQ